MEWNFRSHTKIDPHFLCATNLCKRGVGYNIIIGIFLHMHPSSFKVVSGSTYFKNGNR